MKIIESILKPMKIQKSLEIYINVNGIQLKPMNILENQYKK